MAKTKISEFSVTPGDNTEIDGINIDEGCSPANLNNAIRELMSQLKDFQAGNQASNQLAIAGGGTNATTAADARTNLGIGTMGTQSASSVAITGGSISGITDLAVADGGTGTSSLTANNVILGNGTSAVQFVAPGSSGNVLTSNGTTWTSSTPAGDAVTSVNSQTGAVVTTTVGNVGSIIVAMYAPGTHPGTTAFSLNIGDTASGSNLRYGASSNLAYVTAITNTGFTCDFGTYIYQGSTTYAGGGTSLSGTWRCIGRPGYGYLADTAYMWFPGLFVRVS